MEKIRTFVRSAMFHVAGFIDYWTKGRIKPAHITALSLAGHVPVAWALVVNRPVLAAMLLAMFSILDAVDGALARVQGSASISGMFFDAVSDRLKEVILYSALAVYAFDNYADSALWMLVALCGSSLLVSYVKAKGEMAVSGEKQDAQKLNRLFSVGFTSYEIRMMIIIAGLATGSFEYLLPLLIAANLLTVALRFIVISKELYRIDTRAHKKSSHEN